MRLVNSDIVPNLNSEHIPALTRDESGEAGTFVIMAQKDAGGLAIPGVGEFGVTARGVKLTGLDSFHG